MGDILAGIFGGGSQQTQTTKPDATSQRLNDIRQEQISNLFGNYNSFADLAVPNAGGAFTPTNATGQLTSSALDKYSQGVNFGQPDLSNLMSLDDYINFGLNQASNYISQIATPEILSTAALQGLEGGGYVPEAIAKATAGIGLPFAQSLPGASVALTQAPEQASLLRAQTGATGAQAGLTGAQQASTLFPLTDYTRALSEADINRRQGILTTGLTGIPYTPGTSTAGKTSQQPLFNFFGQG